MNVRSWGLQLRRMPWRKMTKRYFHNEQRRKAKQILGTREIKNEARRCEGRERVAAGFGSVAVRFYESRLRVSLGVSDTNTREGRRRGADPSRKVNALARQRGFGTFSFWEDENKAPKKPVDQSIGRNGQSPRWIPSSWWNRQV
jgi:hypothetical protein